MHVCMCLQVRGEAQALRSEMETQRNRATQLEQLFQQQVRHRFPPVPPPPPHPPWQLDKKLFPLLLCVIVF